MGMKRKVVLLTAILLLSLTACGVGGLAQNAADATACKALNSTLTAVISTYQSGLVDTGLITQIDNLVGDQARALLSTELAADISALTNVLKDTQSAQGSQERVDELNASISSRCSEVGASIGG